MAKPASPPSAFSLDLRRQVTARLLSIRKALGVYHTTTLTDFSVVSHHSQSLVQQADPSAIIDTQIATKRRFAKCKESELPAAPLCRRISMGDSCRTVVGGGLPFLHDGS
jgi:hypothetical protein